jgi:hypothetical protein
VFYKNGLTTFTFFFYQNTSRFVCLKKDMTVNPIFYFQVN